MFASLRTYLRDKLTRRRIIPSTVSRRVQIHEEAPSDRFVLVIALMIVFFVGLIVLELVHMVLLGTWNEVVFNGIMLIVGTIVGAIWGNTAQ